MTLERDVLSVAGRIRATTQQKSHWLAGRSKYVWQQPERHGWIQTDQKKKNRNTRECHGLQQYTWIWICWV